jgi:hypothetical protein
MQITLWVVTIGQFEYVSTIVFPIVGTGFQWQWFFSLFVNGRRLFSFRFREVCFQLPVMDI